MNSLGMDNPRVTKTRFLAFYSGNSSGHLPRREVGKMAN